jgi:hypothetical protein
MKHLKILAQSSVVAMTLCCIAPASAAEWRLACDQVNNNDAKMSARYIHTNTRALFDVSFKAPTAANFTALQSLEVRVDGYVVGYATLTVREGGSVGASLSFDSYTNAGNARNASAGPFPASWPGLLPPATTGIGAGSRIMIGSLGCTLA